ncbi:hypothetical protein CesoFtcFv8_017006 [Champsocephalus esox]|uniref:Uncharacterized protein n=1 Tax=Champsocephalus esox TaxID=159716 RepID=A0AAN8BK81_9TELE|nr:hypothetical protein CesoFtcFv8_017006 [Champsocephalus esox]
MVDLTVKAEDNSGNLCPTSCPGPMDGVIDLTVGQRTCQQQVIQRMLPGVQVKVEAETDSRSPPAAGLSWEGKGSCDSGRRGPLTGLPRCYGARRGHTTKHTGIIRVSLQL